MYRSLQSSVCKGTSYQECKSCLHLWLYQTVKYTIFVPGNSEQKLTQTSISIKIMNITLSLQVATFAKCSIGKTLCEYLNWDLRWTIDC